MFKKLGVLAVAALVAAPVMANILPMNGATFGVTPNQSGYQPLSYAQLVELGAAESNPTGSTYAGGSLVQNAGAFFLDTGPNTHTWTGGGKSIGTNAITGAGMTMFETYLPGAGPNGGDIIQVNIFTNNGSIWVPAGATDPAGAILTSWRIDVGSTAHPNPIEVVPGGQVLLSSGARWWNGATVLGTFPLTLNSSTPNSVGGVAVVGLGGANIAGFALTEGAVFFELIPEPSSLALLALGGLMLRRRR